jgi:hypothetical protein
MAASCKAEKRIIALRRVKARVASRGCWKNRLTRWRKRKAGEYERDEN